MKRILFLGISALIVACLAVFSAHAQLGTADLNITTVPINPQPLQNVQIRLQSFGFDLSQATITWKNNGTVIATGIGRTTVNIIAPGNGKVATITATADSSDFATTMATLLLRPASVDLLWEGADSYTPPFYKGRALPSVNGLIRVTAIPAISAPHGITYDWTENDSAMQDASGYEKTSIVFKNDSLNNTETIGVNGSNSSFNGSNTITITPGNPDVVGYFNTDGFIDYSNGSTNALTTGATGAVLHFEPYYFSVPNNIPTDLTFSYTDNGGANILTGGSQNELRLSRPDGGGQSQFNVGITTSTYSLQNLTRLFSLNFN